MNKIKTVLVANRGEIAIRVFRACNELDIRTIAVFSREDKLSLHRFKADESYLIGEGKGPVEAYLDIDSILEVAHRTGTDAIHPGYGFLSENSELARRCQEEGFIFIGPQLEHLIMFGDKINARNQAHAANIPMIPGSDGPIGGIEDVRAFAQEHGYPLIIKATLGGGGRGMRIVRNESSLEESFYRAKSEAKASFGNDEVYLEKLLEFPKHIEVQVLGDTHGNLIHLYERDCSVQRRHQKLVEIAPSVALPEDLREQICASAVKLMKNVNYISAGTVEFLVTPDNQFYFIEVNPRIQVEHTITEMVTGIDIVHAQLHIADGAALTDPRIGIPPQEEIFCHGHAIQCRITTEDASNNFMPDTGKIMAYRSSGGFGVRLDAGNAFAGSVITPYYDSLLVKVSTWGLSHQNSLTKMLRCLKEFRIRGIKTNIPFLENVVMHEQFKKGTYDTCFVDTSPELFDFPEIQDRGTKLLSYLGDVAVNGYARTGKPAEIPDFPTVRHPKFDAQAAIPSGTKQFLDTHGPAALARWIKEQPQVLLTDTTWRDAHQSLLATRIRTKDMLDSATATAHLLPSLFSLEMWGGATFDVAYRFLKEDPWQRLQQLREKCPNLLFQMLLRASNAVGYTNYPDNVVREFVRLSAQNGIDIFRIFDSLNWMENMTVAIEEVLKSGKIAEAAICYSGDILDASRTKYDLPYYVNMAKELEKTGAHIIAIKDMAGLLKPEAAYRLVSALKEAVDLPIHLHTHDTSGNGIYAYARAIDAGVDIVDVCVSSMAGGTSQPSANSLCHALSGHPRCPQVNTTHYQNLSSYWEDIRHYYKGVDVGGMFPNTEVYAHEMPGGQYTNLLQQAKALGLEDRWDEVKTMYRRVNDMFGDIIKVTPSSKIVGDMALYMLENNLTEDEVYERGDNLSFPDSVTDFFQGQIGIPYQGFPKELQRIILKGKKPLKERAGKFLPSARFDEIRETLATSFIHPVTEEDIISSALYPKVFNDWAEFARTYGDVSTLSTPAFFFGLRAGEELKVDIEQGKTLLIKLIQIGLPAPDGTRVVNFELNGLPREVIIRDYSLEVQEEARQKADRGEPGQIGASLSGTVVKVLVSKGTRVIKGTPLVATEAMKMETTIQAPMDSLVKSIHVKAGDAIHAGDLLVTLVKE